MQLLVLLSLLRTPFPCGKVAIDDNAAIMGTIEKFATKVIWLDRGVVAAMGEPKEVIEQYLAASKVKKRPPDEY